MTAIALILFMRYLTHMIFKLFKDSLSKLFRFEYKRQSVFNNEIMEAVYE